MHWERTRSVQQSVAYCSDPTKRTGRIWKRGFTVEETPLDIISEHEHYTWQKELTMELRSVPDPRKVIWYADADGNTGKTEFLRWAITRLPNVTFIQSASSRDIAHHMIKLATPPTTVIVALTRQNEGALSYQAIENIKDGIIFSTKYEGGQRLIPRPHLVVFANWLPDRAKLSQDRWDIRCLKSNPPRRIYELDPALL